MTTYPLHIAFSSYTIIGLTLLILSASMAVYLLRQGPKTPASRALIAFFLLVAISGFTTILANAFFYWDRLFVPWQDFWILIAGFALVQFAYSLPQVERSLESRVVRGAVGALVLLALGYCLVFSYRFLNNWSPGLNVSDAYYLLLPLGTLLVVLVFLRRCVYLSRQDQAGSERQVVENVWGYLVHPQGNDAKAFRSLAMALSLAFLPGLQTLVSFPGPFGFILSNIGSILAIIAIALVYFNFAPEIHSFMAKLVGITLSSVLLITAVFASVELYLAQRDLSEHRQQALVAAHNELISVGDLISEPHNVAYVVSWEQVSPQDAGSYRQLFRSEQEENFDLDVLIEENQAGWLESASPLVNGPTADDWRIMRRYWSYPPGSSMEDYWGYIFSVGSRSYEIGYSAMAEADAFSVEVLKWLVLIATSSAFILLVFPLFFRHTLVEPLENLLQGIRQVDRGILDSDVQVIFNDEIGLLTKAFNRMLKTIRSLTSDLQDRALNLEEQISERTLELVRINRDLETENQNREMAEFQLNQQLKYQQALAGCSQILMMVAEIESEQWDLLQQALEQLLYGAQASRTYIFRSFDDPELGRCIGMKAEVCAQGIPVHINNPANRKFPLSSMPSEFGEALSQGKPYGGPIKQVFASTPNLRDAFLAQSPPLLSVLLFPVMDREVVWGFIGFDDCKTERQWNTWEIGMLGTAAEMIGNTLQRWGIETQLKETLDELELRVEDRTAALSQSNLLLNAEIQQRRQAQSDLERRLQVEAKLATISARLLETSGIYRNIRASLEDLAGIMAARRVFLAEFDLENVGQVSAFTEWYDPELQPISGQDQRDFLESYWNLQERLLKEQTIYIQDTSTVRDDLGINLGILRERNVQSFVISPIVINQRIQAILGCSNLSGAAQRVQTNLRALELVTDMLKSLLQREGLIDSLERQVAERTRQLTTFLDMAMLTDQSQELGDILQPTLLSITQIATCDAAGIYILDEKKANLMLIAQRGIQPDFLDLLSVIEVDDELRVWMDSSDLYTPLGDAGDVPKFPEPFCLPDFGAYFANRLGTREKSLGLLCCYRVAEQPFSVFQVTLLNALAELIGIIVENNRLRIEAGELAAVEERQRLAREIHDAISQSVYSLSLFARSASDAAEAGNPEKLQENLQDLEETALRSMREMRLLLYQLRESRQDQDLASALKDRFKQVENRLGIKASQQIKGEISLPNHIRHELWRILVEALNNMVKHAEATQVSVSVSCQEAQLLVCVQDNGVGFDPQGRYPGMGLKNMQQRAEMMGGKLAITSEPGQGTYIELTIPSTCLDLAEGDW
ncbi:MAG: GAF domain-containing protein [Anaerolineales bacterium]|jgi:nitrate/nitrite-specific signal transduction histidine kinase